MRLSDIAQELRRTNFAGRTVTLAEGALVAAALPALVAVRARPADAAVLAGIGALGLADDIVEHRQRLRGQAVSKGLRGHLRALARGQLTTGGAKALGIPALALLGALGAPRPRRPLTEAALVAGTANLANLLDLRPGRALKGMLALDTPLAVATASPGRARSGQAAARAVVLVGAAALPADLGEHGMLGDVGANALGAAAGLAIARRAPRPLALGALAAVCALTLASEKVSFSAVIARTPVLDALDRLGRRPVAAADGPCAEDGA